ncbi:CHAT domain-containing protein [Nocardiopsis sp. Huas11]|uniref:CHAT domain-containing protein n=1 Tax=Nocardiopsis sp. Huas11 TaxID=2183912 RepID=UPI000F220547|nr:CHAT domain-containing protein [Nocardiopsis sp. Huas11]RKS04762.1 CHAT domain-containing protein [Nocardiopsis sp. Huas11]
MPPIPRPGPPASRSRGRLVHRSAGPSPDPGSGHALMRRVVRGVRLAQYGRFEETVSLLTEARVRLRGHPVAASAPVVPGVLANLGLAQTLCGRYGPADDHLREARALAQERRLPLMDLVVRQNQGCLALHRGDAVAAIGTFLDLRDRLPGDRRDALRVDLAEALLAEGLVEEAATVLHEGSWSGDGEAAPATLLVEAKLRLLDGSPTRAVELIRRVRRSNGAGSLWHRLAVRLETMAHRVARTARPTGPADALGAHATLGTPATLDDALRTPATLGPAEPLGRAGEALALRAPLAAPEAPVPDRTAHRALRALARSTAAAPGAWAGPAVADPHVVRAGLERALLEGDAATALEWADLGRTWAAPLVPGPHAPRSRALTTLTEHYRAALARGGDPRSGARRWESERWRALYTSTPAARAHGPAGPVVPAMVERLADRAFVHLVRALDDLVAIVATSEGVRARPLGPFRRAARTLADFTHEAPRSQGAPTPDGDAVHALVAPVLPLVGDRGLVVAADPALGDPPWGMLPALCGRTLSLVPTARFWTERTTPPPAPRRVLLVAGTEPDGARAEVAALADLHPAARVLTGARTRPEDVLAEFGRADLVHLAAHGRVPDDAPLLASVELPRGPLLACDLRDVTAAPAVVTLSTCWTGRGFATAPGLPSGFVGALLARGTRTVVASPVPVEDASTGRAMRAFHRALVAGTPVPEAVALHLGRSGFCCYGA